MERGAGYLTLEKAGSGCPAAPRPCGGTSPAGNPSRLTRGPYPLLIDEWQRIPAAWDLVRRAVDDDPSAGRYLLTGSAATKQAPVHSGAGRIVSLRMRPLTLAERSVSTPTVSLARLVTDGISADLVSGRCELTVPDYTAEIISGGFPALRAGTDRAVRAALDGYLQRIIDVELPGNGAAVRRPETLRRWRNAYAVATPTAASYDKIRDAATAGEGDKPANPRPVRIGTRWRGCSSWSRSLPGHRRSTT